MKINAERSSQGVRGTAASARQQVSFLPLFTPESSWYVYRIVQISFGTLKHDLVNRIAHKNSFFI